MPKYPLPRSSQPGTVYLIHLDKPIGAAQHYAGWALDPIKRLREHQTGRGGRLLQIANSRSISYIIARTWQPADRRFERRVKNYSNARYLCPVCNPASWETRLVVVGDAKPKRQKAAR